MRNKEGRRTSHSNWSWTHGPRETTHDSSGRRPWWWRSSGGDPPLRQGAGKGSPGAPDLGSGGGGGTEMRSRKRVPVSRVSGDALNICQRGASEEPRGAQAPPRRGPGGAPPGRLEPWWPPPRLSFGRTVGSGTLIF